MELILASTSPYRRELLGRLRLPFRVEAPEVDEQPLPDESPAGTATRLALAKAAAVFARRPQVVVIGSDQVATLDDRSPIGKPGDFARARAQLRQASGRNLRFHTAFAVLSPDAAPIVESVTVDARFRVLGDAEIDAYLRLEQPYDCAGSAKSEGLGITLLERMHTDDPTALVGLPLIRLSAALRRLGIDPLAVPGPG